MDELDELSRRLWLLQEQMEQLVCALDIQGLVMAHDRLRWLPTVTENVELLVDDIRTSEAERVPHTTRAARKLGLDERATLAEMAEAAGEPYRTAWRRHRLNLVALNEEIDQITASNRELGRRGAAAAQEILAAVGAPAPIDTYDPSGSTEQLAPASRRFDRTA
ncbi:flagellar export chaperone FlgN [Ilumatobacter sp.]|uniref:flagellar export chaperone FlgN n=1 Tax=Ilumatobacter sp. TaxID=1967498 RepID=UPI003B52327C